MLTLYEHIHLHLISEAVIQNKHSTHLEDLVLDGGKKSTGQVLDSMSKIADKFSSQKASKDIGVSIKYDGAPAVFFGYLYGKFFVGTKAIFNKTPKINFSEADIDMNHVGGLAEKLKVSLVELKKVCPNNGIVYQGDLMFTKGDLKNITTNGVKYTTCHPNTIVYAAPVDSDLGKKWTKANLGIVVHTQYEGTDISTMSASFGVQASDFKKTGTVWLEDAFYKSFNGVVTFSKTESNEFNKRLTRAKKLAAGISSSTFKQLSGDLNAVINTYNNTFIRANSRVSTKDRAAGLSEYIIAKFQKEIDKRKSDKGKQTQIDKRDVILKAMPKLQDLSAVYELQDLIVEMKDIIMQKLDDVAGIATFIVTKSGEIKVTGQEGYVGLSTSDIPSGVKLVDRYGFSFNNFSPDIKKGWESDSRN